MWHEELQHREQVLKDLLYDLAKENFVPVFLHDIRLHLKRIRDLLPDGHQCPLLWNSSLKGTKRGYTMSNDHTRDHHSGVPMRFLHDSIYRVLQPTLVIFFAHVLLMSKSASSRGARLFPRHVSSRRRSSARRSAFPTTRTWSGTPTRTATARIERHVRPLLRLDTSAVGQSGENFKMF